MNETETKTDVSEVTEDSPREAWDEMIRQMHSGEQIRISEEVFNYFLDVLPPVFMNRRFNFKDGQSVKESFGFAEGAENVVIFWQDGTEHFCRQSTMMNPCA